MIAFICVAVVLLGLYLYFTKGSGERLTINLSPEPADDIIRFKIKGDVDLNGLRRFMWNSKGHRITDNDITSSDFIIETKDLPNDYYYLVIFRNKENLQTEKFTIPLG